MSNKESKITAIVEGFSSRMGITGNSRRFKRKTYRVDLFPEVKARILKDGFVYLTNITVTDPDAGQFSQSGLPVSRYDSFANYISGSFSGRGGKIYAI